MPVEDVDEESFPEACTKARAKCEAENGEDRAEREHVETAIARAEGLILASPAVVELLFHRTGLAVMRG